MAKKLDMINISIKLPNLFSILESLGFQVDPEGEIDWEYALTGGGIGIMLCAKKGSGATIEQITEAFKHSKAIGIEQAVAISSKHFDEFEITVD